MNFIFNDAFWLEGILSYIFSCTLGVKSSEGFIVVMELMKVALFLAAADLGTGAARIRNQIVSCCM